jgi:dienelactone hydrolase
MRKDRSTYYFLLSTLVVVAFLLHAAWAQVADTGTMLGTVTDSTWTVVPGVSITLRNPESNLTYKTVTDESGEFRFLTYVQVEFSDADHGFFCDVRPSYNPKAATESWALTHAFLANHLGIQKAAGA